MLYNTLVSDKLHFNYKNCVTALATSACRSMDLFPGGISMHCISVGSCYIIVHVSKIRFISTQKRNIMYFYKSNTV
jgi:hypothetical protein